MANNIELDDFDHDLIKQKIDTMENSISLGFLSINNQLKLIIRQTKSLVDKTSLLEKLYLQQEDKINNLTVLMEYLKK